MKQNWEKEDVMRPLFNFIEMPERLLAWYDQNRRILPWREDPKPYYVWISEIMLQQTRVEAALDYYNRFLQALPSLSDLADAPEEQLLKLWEGLGYYNRVRNLQKAAKICMEQFDGRLPHTYETLKSLPGIGEYTAGAIGSIAFQLPVTAVDGNVLRVMARLSADDRDITKPAVKASVTELVQRIQPPQRPGDFNQAIMDLGATVCLPNGVPKCGECPLACLCEANKQGTVLSFPVKPEKKPRKKETLTAFVLLRKGQAALHKRGKAGMLKNLWEFPNVGGMLTEKEARAQCESWKLKAETLTKADGYRHVFTHVEWQVTVYVIEVSGEGVSDFQWASKSTIRDVAIPSAFKPCLEEALKRLALSRES